MSDDLKNRLEALEKAIVPYTEAGAIAAGTNWAGAAPADSFRDQMGANAVVQLTDAERQFIVDRVIDESGVLKMVRKLTMNRSRVEIPRMSLGDRVMRASHAGGHHESRPYYAGGAGPTGAFAPALPSSAAAAIDMNPLGLESGVDEFLVSPEYSVVVLQSSKLVLPWAITEEFLEDNPEKGAAEQRIATIMGIQAANDLEDLAWNGDETSSDALLRANQGWLDAASAAGRETVDAVAFTTDTLERMVRGLDTKYRRNLRQLRFFVHPDRWMDYVQSIAARQGNMADQYLAGLVGDPTYGGIPLVASPFMPEDDLFLSHPDNLIFGVERDMKMRKTADGQGAIYNDERYYAMHIRCDFVIQNTEAVNYFSGVLPRVF